MATNQGPRVLEFNCRFGDPETQPLFMRLRTDLLDILEAVVDDRLDMFHDKPIEWDPRPSICVVMASQGYPGNYAKNKLITGLDEAAKLTDVKVFHAGTRKEGDWTYTDGGRVLAVTALGDTLADAKARAYEAVHKINFQGAFYRTDIADKALKK
jgi:phosphoribosylamine--glycine ligase